MICKRIHGTVKDACCAVLVLSLGMPVAAQGAVDLTVISVTVEPSSGLQCGQTISVCFVVQNVGSTGTNCAPWDDCIHWSTDSTFGDADDIELECSFRDSNLPAGSSYAVCTTVTVPCPCEDGFILVKTDTNLFCPESNESNNVGSTSVSCVCNPPSAPSGLLCAANGCSSIDLFWNDNSNNEDEFEIFRSVGCTGSYSEVGSTGPNDEDWPDFNVDPCSTYCYRVRARNSCGSSSFSNTTQCSTACGPPCCCTSNSQCNDGNSCTTDACQSGCCVNDPITPCCGNGSCCDANDTPGCENQACCETVCAVDPFCCGADGGVWDGLCAIEACQLCGICGNCGACCCGPDCFDAIPQSVCVDLGCDYEGHGTSCSPDTCDDRSCGDGFCDSACGENCSNCPQDCGDCGGCGACCCSEVGQGCFDHIQEFECVDVGCDFAGSGVSCAELTDCGGACCCPEGCFDHTQETVCLDAGCDFAGDGVPCAESNCPGGGACCCPDGCFDHILEAVCLGSGCEFAGIGVSCAEFTDCGGACCFPDGSCLDHIQESTCVDAGFDYQGDGTSCAGCCDCDPSPVCGDGFCDSACGETAGNCPADCDCEDAPYTIGGAVYTYCDDPLGSGQAGVEVCVECEGGFSECTESSGAQGLWQISGVPCDTCTVTAEIGCCHVEDICPPDPCVNSVVIEVNDANVGPNQSIQFDCEECFLYDMNCDGFISIIGDVPPFVDCVYFGDCCCGEECECDCVCAGDCNCDGFLSIIGDVPCFVDCVYFNNCVECLAAEGGDGFTIGGAVYEREVDPLFSGIENVIVQVLDSNAKVVGETTTGPFGLWRVGGLREGKYLVIFGGADDGGNRVKIDVNEENEAANQSIHLRRSSEPTNSRPSSYTVPRD